MDSNDLQNSLHEHLPVLFEEVIANLAVPAGGFAIDATFGRGGHTAALLEAVGADGHVLACDRDVTAINYGISRFALEISQQRLALQHGPFSELAPDKRPDVIFADIGLSSPQLEEASRGFSWRHDGPLDMRFDQRQPRTAADILAEDSEEELADLFWRLGDERRSRTFARAIVAARDLQPITTTSQLAALIVKRSPPGGKHPARRVFQALRMAINDEQGELVSLLKRSFAMLKPGGRFGVITFHSGEDRLVKRAFRQWAGLDRPKLPRGLPIREVEVPKSGRLIRPFPIEPKECEVTLNPRARSAKLRVIVKCVGGEESCSEDSGWLP